MNTVQAVGTPVPVINTQDSRNDIPDAAFEMLSERLRGWGNDLSVDHAQGLHNLLKSYHATALGRTAKRQAWPLAVGCGKTVSIAAYASALTQKTDTISIMVAQNTIEALCSLKRLMIAWGVPSDRIGLVHSKDYDPDHAEDRTHHKGDSRYASEPSIRREDSSHYQVLLLSHEMLKTSQDIYEFDSYNDAKRSLVIWDETLLKSNGRCLPLDSVKAALGASQGLLEGSGDAIAIAAIRYMGFAVSEIESELERQNSGEPASALRLPDKQDCEVNDWSVAIKRLLAGRPDDYQALVQFLRLTQEPIRAIQLSKGAVLKYDLVIPKDFHRVIVLDASYNIRELVRQYDEDINLVDSYASVKDFSSVVASQLHHSGGRTSVDRELRKKGSGLTKALVERVHSYPEDEGVILFTYLHRGKSRQRSHRDILESALKSSGIDTEAKLQDGKPRFVWLTWGQELGLSDYAYCRHVVLTGIYRKSRDVIATQIAGQMDDLTASAVGDSKAIREVELSEIFHALYQAMGRGSCRSTNQGRAAPMTLDWIGTEEFPDSYWQEAAPNIQRQQWTSSHITPRKKALDNGMAIKGYLEGLPDSIEYVRSVTVKTGAGLEGISLKAFQRARESASKELLGWSYEGSQRGYIRNPFA